MGAPTPIRNLVAALRKRFGSRDPDEVAEGAKEGAEEISKQVPKMLMPRDAVAKQRTRQQQAWDAAKDD